MPACAPALRRLPRQPWPLFLAAVLVALSATPAGGASLILTLGEALPGRVREIADTLNAAPASRPAHMQADRVTDAASLISAITTLRDGDVLYLNTHSNNACVALGETNLTFEDLAQALRRGPGRPARLLLLVLDGCMHGGTRADFASLGRAFNAELVLGWTTYTNSVLHTSAMLAILDRLFTSHAPLAEIPPPGTPQIVGRPYLFAPSAYYGRTIDQVKTNVLDRLNRGAPPDLGTAAQQYR